MKKFVICLILCLSVLGFVACGNVPEGDYWAETRSELAKIYEDEKYSALNNLEFSENVKYFMDINDEFKELDSVYDNTLSSCLSFLNSYNILAIAPNTNNKSFYDKLTNLVNNSKKFENDIDAFLNNKQYFENSIDVVVSTYGKDYILTDNISLNYLLKFKRDYLTLIEKAYSLANDFFSSIYSEGYISLEKVSVKEEENTSYSLYKILSLNATKLKTVKNLISTIKEYDCRVEIEEMQSMFELQNSFYSKANSEHDFSNTDNDYENFVNWQNIFKKYNNEQKIFEEILNKIDMLEIARDYNGDIDEYSKDKNNTEMKVYYQYVINFAKTESILINATYKFCNM